MALKNKASRVLPNPLSGAPRRVNVFISKALDELNASVDWHTFDKQGAYQQRDECAQA